MPGGGLKGLGALIGASTIGTVVALDMLNTFSYRLQDADLGLGFFAGFVAPFVLIAAGALAVVAARRESDVGFAALSRSDWAAWSVLVLAAAGALTLVAAALETYPASGVGPSGALGGRPRNVGAAWRAVLARPVLLGRWMLIGWCLGVRRPSPRDLVAGMTTTNPRTACGSSFSPSGHVQLWRRWCTVNAVKSACP